MKLLAEYETCKKNKQIMKYDLEVGGRVGNNKRRYQYDGNVVQVMETLHNTACREKSMDVH